MTLEAAIRTSTRLTDEVIEEAARRHLVTLDNPGLCLACGNEQGDCEPDAHKLLCEACGQCEVYGAEELLISIAF